MEARDRAAGRRSASKINLHIAHEPPHAMAGRNIYQIMSITCKRTCTGTSGCHGKKFYGEVRAERSYRDSDMAPSHMPSGQGVDR